MNSLILITSFLLCFALMLLLLNSNLVLAKHKCCSKDFVSLNAPSASYFFEVDYTVFHGDIPATVVKVNKDAAQENAQAKIGQHLEINIFSYSAAQREGIDQANMFLTKDKIKIIKINRGGEISTNIKFGKALKFLNENQCCDENSLSIFGDVPKIKKGTYTIVVHIISDNETERFYLDKIKIS